MQLCLPSVYKMLNTTLSIQNNYTCMSRVSCQKGPTRHARAWQIGPFWQDTLDVSLCYKCSNNRLHANDFLYCIAVFLLSPCTIASAPRGRFRFVKFKPHVQSSVTFATHYIDSKNNQIAQKCPWPFENILLHTWIYMINGLLSVPLAPIVWFDWFFISNCVAHHDHTDL